MSCISELVKHKLTVQVIGRGFTKPSFIYDDIPIMSLGLGYGRPKSSLLANRSIVDINSPTSFKRRDSNPWVVHIPEVKENFGDLMRHRLYGEYLDYLHEVEDMRYQYPTDITPEFLKMKDYLNPDCYPDYDEYDYIWVRYPVFPQVKGLPKCSTSPLPTSISNLWKLKNKMR